MKKFQSLLFSLIACSALAGYVSAADPPSATVATTEEAPRIAVKPTFKVGEKIEISFLSDGTNVFEDAETSLHWTLPPTVQSEAGSSDGRRLLAWAPPGLYDVKLRASYTLDVLVPDPADTTKTKVRKVTFPAYEYTAQFRVEGVVPGPDPQPDPNPNPDPKPLTGLAVYVPDAAKRALTAEFYEDLAAEVAKNAFVSTSHFRAGYRAAILSAQTSGALPKGLTALDQPVSTRISDAIGLADVPLDQSKRDALAAVLNGVAKELRQ